MMEDVLERLVKSKEKTQSHEAIKLLKTYINNVVENPSNPKFRKIRISNPKFHSIIWSIEDARSFLFLIGFEENDGFLVLPEGVCLDAVKIMLENVNLDDEQPSPVKQEKSTPESSTEGNLLKLRNPTDGSVFDEVSKADMTLLSYMKEMGFDVVIAEKALIITKNQGVQPAMDWINSNPAKVDEIRMAAFKKTNTETAVTEASGQEDHKTTATTPQAGPVSRYQATLDERHRFQERLRLEAIEAARVEKANQKRQKEYLLKNLEDEKKERKEKDQWAKCMRMSEAATTNVATSSDHTSATGQQQTDVISIKLRLPDGKVSTLTLQSQCQLSQVYNHILEISDLQEDDFTLMVISPQRKLVDKDKTLEELGLQSHETLIVQRSDQTGSLTQGQGEFYHIIEVKTVEQFETLLWKNSNKLIIVEFYLTSADNDYSAKEFEDLNAKYGEHKKSLFVRANIDLLPALKEDYNIVVFPTYKLIWNRETLCGVEGSGKENLERTIQQNIDGPIGGKVADDTSGDYFDPR